MSAPLDAYEDVPLDDPSESTPAQMHEEQGAAVDADESAGTGENERQRESDEGEEQDDDNQEDEDEEDEEEEEEEDEEDEEEDGDDNEWERRVPQPPEGGAAEERRLIKACAMDDIQTKAGQTWYLISAKWFRSWKDYARYDDEDDDEDDSDQEPVQRPESITNAHLLREGTGTEFLKKDVLEGRDYNIIPEVVWNYLVTWYAGGPPIARGVIATGWNSDQYIVEVRPLLLKLVKSSDKKSEIHVAFSKAATVGELKTKGCKRLKLKPENVRVWDWHARNKIKLLNAAHEQLDEAQILDGQYVLFEEKDPATGNWPAKSSKSYGTGGSYYYSSPWNEPSEPGITGLNNLGNTCFMNSSLQCLSNTPPLANFFLSGEYKRDLNSTNPLGMKGELAEAYASLLSELWSGRCRATAPRNFKWKLEHFAPQFSGYQQHDSQELLGFLLDGLHEDLNRIVQKPYTETVESDGRPDELVATEAWETHKARNNSVIVDWFQGQLKSTLVCPVCSKISITFDPFMYLSLPLPMKTTRDVEVTLFPYDPDRYPMRYKVSLQMFGIMRDLKNALSELIGLPPEALLLTDVYNSRFFREFKDTDNLDLIQDRDIVHAYEILLPEVKQTEEQQQQEEGKEQQEQQQADADNNNEEADKKADKGKEIATDDQENEGQNNGGAVEEAGADEDDERADPNFASEPEEEEEDDEFESDDDGGYYGQRYKSEHQQAHQQQQVDPEELVHIPVLLRRDEVINYVSYYRTPTTYTRKTLIGVPMVLSVKRGVTYAELYRAVLNKLKNVIRWDNVPQEEEQQQQQQGEEEQQQQQQEGEYDEYSEAAAEPVPQISEEQQQQQEEQQQQGSEEAAGQVVLQEQQDDNNSADNNNTEQQEGKTQESGNDAKQEQQQQQQQQGSETAQEQEQEQAAQQEQQSTTIDETSSNAGEGQEQEQEQEPVAPSSSSSDAVADEGDEGKQQQSEAPKGEAQEEEEQQVGGDEDENNNATSSSSSEAEGYASTSSSSASDEEEEEEEGEDDTDRYRNWQSSRGYANSNYANSNYNNNYNNDEAQDYSAEIVDSREQFIDGHRPLFILRAVDNYGMNEQWQMENDDQPLMLEHRQTVAVCWTYDAIQCAVYDEREHRRIEMHESAERRDDPMAGEETVALLDCIDLFTQTEKLGPEDPWYCNRCQEFRQATKKFDLWKTPRILVVHLKRFSYRNRYWREKLDTFVDYPLDNLNLSPFILSGQPNATYELYAVSNHYGSLGGGHYTAFAKNHRNGKWYKFDDSYVSEVSADKVRTSAAYVLFYRLKEEETQDKWVQQSTDEALGRNPAAEEPQPSYAQDINNNESSSSGISSSGEEEEDDDEEEEAGMNGNGAAHGDNEFSSSSSGEEEKQQEDELERRTVRSDVLEEEEENTTKYRDVVRPISSQSWQDDMAAFGRSSAMDDGL